MRPRFAAALLAAAALAGCGALEPYPTAPLAPQAGQPAGARVAICYNALTTSRAELQMQAQQECAASAPGAVAAPVDTDWYMQNCPLLLPARATFVCKTKK